MNIDLKKYITKCCIELGMSMTALAENMGESRQSLCNRLTRNNMKISDIERVAEAMGCELKLEFVRKDSGEKLG